VLAAAALDAFVFVLALKIAAKNKTHFRHFPFFQVLLPSNV